MSVYGEGESDCGIFTGARVRHSSLLNSQLAMRNFAIEQIIDAVMRKFNVLVKLDIFKLFNFDGFYLRYIYRFECDMIDSIGQ